MNLEPTHFNCCHAPKDLGHMFGCPNSEERIPKFKVTGVDKAGRRFRIETNNAMHAFGINLWNGSVWEREGGKWNLKRRSINGHWG